MEEIMNDKWISIDEAAEYLGIKTVTLRSWIRNGKEGLPAQKIGKQWKFCLLYTSPSPRDRSVSRMPSSA